MAFSKVTLNGDTLMDVTPTTVASENLLKNETAVGADGQTVVGSVELNVVKNASGQIISINDAVAGTSPLSAPTGTQIYSRNMYAANIASRTSASVTFVQDADDPNTVVLNGTATGANAYSYGTITADSAAALLEPGKYYICGYADTDEAFPILYADIVDYATSTKTVLGNIGSMNKMYILNLTSKSYLGVRVQLASGKSVSNLKVSIYISSVLPYADYVPYSVPNGTFKDKSVAVLPSEGEVQYYGHYTPDEKPLKLRLITFNVGEFNHGTTSEYPDTPPDFDDYVQEISSLDADILFTQEDRIYKSVTDEITTWDALYKNMYSYGGIVSNSTSTNGMMSKGIYSNIKLYQPDKVTFETQATNHWSSMTTYLATIDGKVWLLLSVHLAPESANGTVRIAQIAEIIDYVDNINPDYCVIAGDFNTWSATELDNLTGYTKANCGSFGQIVTYPTGSHYFDNIIVKPNVKLKGVKAIANSLGDHYAFAADIVFDGSVDDIPGGDDGDDESSSGSKAVNFIDYDGTILYSYSESDALALTDLPANPSHSGLTPQGWNWTLTQIKAQLATMPGVPVWVGQMYITDDGKTRIYCHFETGRLAPYLGLGVNGTVTVDWGDDSSTDTLTGTSLTTAKTVQHTYSEAGDYTIALTVTSGSFAFFGVSNAAHILKKSTATTTSISRVYANAVQRVEMGANASIGTYAFNYCSSLSSITIPDGVTSIGTYAFRYCCNLVSITIPDGVTSINTYAFSNCYNLSSITIPDGVTSIGTYAFSNCSSLASITIPDGVMSIGTYAFNFCSSLASITIADGVTSIGTDAFNNCYSLSSITIPDGVTSIDTSAFYSCYSLSSITIPDGVTSIGSSAFYNCYSLSSITIPDGVTSIGSSVFYSCYGLSSITIPDGVTSIGSSAFYNCYGLGEMHFLPTTPPTVSATNAFTNLQTDCKIYVPAGTLAAYTSATNYPSSSTYTYIEEGAL